MYEYCNPSMLHSSNVYIHTYTVYRITSGNRLHIGARQSPVHLVHSLIHSDTSTHSFTRSLIRHHVTLLVHIAMLPNKWRGHSHRLNSTHTAHTWVNVHYLKVDIIGSHVSIVLFRHSMIILNITDKVRPMSDHLNVDNVCIECIPIVSCSTSSPLHFWFVAFLPHSHKHTHLSFTLSL